MPQTHSWRCSARWAERARQLCSHHCVMAASAWSSICRRCAALRRSAHQQPPQLSQRDPTSFIRHPWHLESFLALPISSFESQTRAGPRHATWCGTRSSRATLAPRRFSSSAAMRRCWLRSKARLSSASGSSSARRRSYYASRRMTRSTAGRERASSRRSKPSTPLRSRLHRVAHSQPAGGRP